MERFRTERFKKGNVLISFLIEAVGIALLLFGFVGIRTNEMVRARCCDKTSAKVISITEASKSVDYVEAEFFVDNTRYTAIAKHHYSKSVGEDSFAEGMPVTVFYDPFDPGDNYIEGANQEDGSNVMTVGGIILVLGMILMGKALADNSRKDKH